MNQQECIKNLKQLLISEKKIIFLLGAGCSYSAGIPKTEEILKGIEDSVKDSDSFKKAINDIKKEQESVYNIETLISTIQSKMDWPPFLATSMLLI